VINGHTLQIGGYGHPEDPLLPNLAANDAMGALVIDFAGRNRLRLNGTAQALPGGEILLTTKQVYGNCQKYIQARARTGAQEPHNVPARRSAGLDERQRNWLTQADTFFIATAHRQAGADASHRGGAPGFIRVENDRRLVFPDYPGNNMFNALGNIESNRRAGLLLPNFQTRAALQLTGKANIHWQDPRISDFAGAQRLIEIEIERVVELPQATRLGFVFGSYARDLPS